MEKTLKKYFALFALPGVVCFMLAFLIPMFMGIYLFVFKKTQLKDKLRKKYKTISAILKLLLLLLILVGLPLYIYFCQKFGKVSQKIICLRNRNVE